MNRVLVIEDDPAILRGLADNLRFEHFEVLVASDGETGYRMLRDERPDCVVLDLMLPRMSGYEVCRKARADGLRVPILMLSARGEEADRVLGLELGADDYLSKPFSIRELIARVRALMRRTQPADSAPEQLRFDDAVVDFLKYEATVGGKPVPMTRKEFAILRALAGRSGQAVTREALLHDVWGYDVTPTTRTVDNHVALLRSKIEKDPAVPRHLITVHGVGYKWVV
jgi:DNA-binding response OmpR family regulator